MKSRIGAIVNVALGCMACVVLLAPPALAGAEIDCANATATAELNACADRELQAADKELNAVYRSALAAVPSLAAEKPYDAKSWERALRASQRAWVGYRDAECAGHLAMFWQGGTGASADILGCKTALTKARTEQLKSRYQTQR
jgi:uncharacterized protein YecT (DUF1311 family)